MGTLKWMSLLLLRVWNVWVCLWLWIIHFQKPFKFNFRSSEYRLRLLSPAALP